LLKANLKRNSAVVFLLVLLGLAFIRIAYVCAQIIKSDIYPFAITELVINYSNGFIRRGLAGSIYMIFFPDGKAGLVVLLIVGLVFLALPLFYAVAWLHKFGYSWAAVLLVCNPAAFLFAFWDTGGFLRKEAIGLMALTILAISMAQSLSQAKRLIFIFSSLLLYTLAVFSSEINCFLLPCFIYILYGLSHKGLSAFWYKFSLALFSLTCMLGLLTGIFFTGSKSFRAPICSSVVSKGLSESFCGGAIDFIGFPIKGYFDLVISYLPSNALFLFLFLPISLIPIVFTSWFKMNKTFFLLFGIIVAPLFLVAIDYGRTIAMFVTGVTICLISNSEPVKSSINLTGVKVIPFVTLWGVPVYIGPEQKSVPWLGPVEWLFTRFT
jgi:hypothetical protein